MASLRRDYLTLAVLALVMIVLPRFIDNSFHLDVLTKIGIFAIVALGLNLVMGYAGQISLGHAAFFGVGAYVSMIMTVPDRLLHNWLASFKWMPEFIINLADACHAFTMQHMFTAAILAAIVTGLIALVVGIPTLRLKGHYLAMATLGFGIILEIVFKEELELTGGISGNRAPKLMLGSWEVNPSNNEYYYLVWGVLLVLVLLSIHLVHSRQGRALRAIHADEMAASTSGVPVMRTKLMIFTLSAVYASFAGTLYAHYQTHVSPSTFGFMESVKLVVMVVVGGMGSIWGGLLGAALLYSLPQLLTEVEDYEMAIFGLILIVVMMTSPKGLAGIFDDLRRKIQGLFQREEKAS